MVRRRPTGILSALKTMRRLLQRIEDGRYYRGPGEWTDNLLEAHVFSETPSAIARCLEEDLPSVRLVLSFENSAYDVYLPLWRSRNAARAEFPGPGKLGEALGS